MKDDSLFLPIQLTVNGDRPGVSCGLADFIAQEEMDRCDNVMHCCVVERN